ncbi:MAG: hypothetical protein MUQ10_12780 [Anaerolineae bacterium]|nr:hypothetical protein [Anaerolineae bacterium]
MARQLPEDGEAVLHQVEEPAIFVQTVPEGTCDESASVSEPIATMMVVTT